METRYIKINKDANNKIQYLKEVLPKIPANTILYKKLTGLGATYGELKADRHSIIIEPNVPVIIGKCEDSKHKADALFGVYKGVNTEDVIEYLNKNKGRFYKILTTPESFKKVKDAFEDDQNIEIVNIGDSVRARRIIEGTEEGRNILNTLEKRGYL